MGNMANNMGNISDRAPAFCDGGYSRIFQVIPLGYQTQIIDLVLTGPNYAMKREQKSDWVRCRATRSWINSVWTQLYHCQDLLKPWSSTAALAWLAPEPADLSKPDLGCHCSVFAEHGVLRNRLRDISVPWQDLTQPWSWVLCWCCYLRPELILAELLKHLSTA